MRDLLTELADMLRYLPLMRTTRTPGVEPVCRHNPDPPAPVSLPILDLETQARAVLTGWARILHDDCALDDWPDDDLSAIAGWLADHATLLDTHEAARSARDELRDLHREVRLALGERGPRRPRCVRIIAGQACATPLVGVTVDGDTTTDVTRWSWVKCPACGQTYTLDAGLKRLGQLQHATLQQWADEHGVPRRTVAYRVKTAGIRPIGRRGRGGEALYLVDDLRRVAA